MSNDCAIGELSPAQKKYVEALKEVASLRAQLAAATQRIEEAEKWEQTMIDDATIKRVAEGLCDVRKVPTQGKSGVRNRKDYAFSSRRLREFARAIEQLARDEQREEIAEWYSKEGWLLDEDDVADAIRKMKGTK